MAKSKKMVILSDLHCGHLAGLTPPRWQVQAPEGEGRTKREKFAVSQKEAWNWYLKTITRNGPYDVVVVNGDAIDGRGERSGGLELITSDREEQVAMATVAVQKAMNGRKTKVVLTYGTPYHVGDQEDWENMLADNLYAEKIGAHEWIDMGGVIFDFKHNIGGSSVPHGRATAVSRETLWAKLWADCGKIPDVDVLVRSHVHYRMYVEDSMGVRLITPALQTQGSKYGARRCSGTVDFGITFAEVSDGEYSIWFELADLESEKSSAIVV